MTISATTDKTIAAGNGATTVFSFNFLIQSAAQLAVIYTDANGNQTPISAGNYSVAFTPGTPGGTVTYNPGGTPIASGTTLTMYRTVALTQLTNLRNQGSYNPGVVESALDYLTMIAQQVSETVGRGISVPIVDQNPVVTLPAAIARKNSFLAFDVNGNPIVSAGVPSVPISAALAPVVQATTTSAALQLLGGAIILDSISALRAVVHTNMSRAFVTGYYAAGDGGGGVYYYDSTDTTSTDNGGSVIVATDGGRWKLLGSDRVSVKQFGAKGDGVQIASSGVSITAGTPNLTVVGATFGAADVGKSITVPGAGTAGAVLGTTITAVVDATHVTLAANAGTTLAAVAETITYGTNDATAIQNAINVASIIYVPAALYIITAMLSVSLNNTWLIGAGAGGLHDTGSAITAPTRFIWNGAAGGTMCRIKSATTQAIVGHRIEGIFWDGNATLAALGVNLFSTRSGEYDIVGAHFSTSIVQLDIDTGLAEPAGVGQNLFRRIGGYQTNASDGAHLIENSTATYNCSQNLFLLIEGDFLNTAPVVINGSDSETFFVLKLYRSTGGTAVGVILSAGATANQAARNNMFYYVGINGAAVPVPVFARGTTYAAFPSIENNVVFLDTANNPTSPSLDTGASLWWGTLRSPVGQRSAFVFNTNNNKTVLSDGRVRYSGLTASLASGASAVITYPTALGTGVIKASATPLGAAGAGGAAIAPTLTQVTVYNNTTVAAQIYWEVEGI